MPHPPRPVCSNPHPHKPCRTLRPPPGQDTPTTPWARLPIPLGRCARFYIPTAPARHSDHPLLRTPRRPRPVCPNLPPHGPCRTPRPTPGQDSPSPQAGVPESTSPHALQDTPSTPCARLPVPQAGVPGSTSPQALQDTPTTPWAGLPVPLGRCARFYLPAGPAEHSDHLLGRTPLPPRPVCPVLPPRRPCRTLQPPLGRPPFPQDGVPGSTSPEDLHDTPTRPVCPNLHPHKPYRGL